MFTSAFAKLRAPEKSIQVFWLEHAEHSINFSL